VAIPRDNERELKEIPANIKQGLDIRPVRWIDEVLTIALQRMPEPLSAPYEPPAAATDEAAGDQGIRAH